MEVIQSEAIILLTLKWSVIFYQPTLKPTKYFLLLFSSKALAPDEIAKQADKQVHQNYYFFVYAQQSIKLDLIYESIDVIHELDLKQRKIRSLRGFFLYALEIMETGKYYESTQKYSLFHLKSYSIKYESIRRIKLYQPNN